MIEEEIKMRIMTESENTIKGMYRMNHIIDVHDKL
jgi:hypothetical protein